MRTRIKICGVCRPQDAAFAATAGADAIGLNFQPNTPRVLSLELAADIVAALPAFVASVGIFVDVDAGTILKSREKIGFTAVQLHGHESPELVAQLKPLRIVKGLRLRGPQDLAFWKKAIAEHSLTNLVGLVLETPSAKTGGSGIPNDWDAIAKLKCEGHFDGLPPMITAGGLTPQTVADVVRLLRPYAVDVSSGVEISKREKSEQKIADFIAAVRQADDDSVDPR